MIEMRESWLSGVAVWRDDLLAAIGFLTRFPLASASQSWVSGRVYRAFPLAGVLIGIVGGTLYGLAVLVGLPPLVAAFFALAGIAVLTGALHEDGLADVADGFGGGGTAERRLEIMRDSRTGAFGALALVFTVGLKVSALAALADPWVVLSAMAAAAAASRAVFPGVIFFLDPARADGLGRASGIPDRETMILTIALGAALALFFLGPLVGTVALLAAAAAVALLALLARRMVGGFTGDVLGAAQQVAEIAILLAVVGMA
ncbi:MAG: adenosylcobinamide-GDP ribazoletransferase [Rhodospirillales bacterium]|nr:adenosylcobinamide-GDP ribazoletransferase [Rhodospirillales bacterium]